MSYLIGEIGQNHNGSVDIAKLIIDAAARPIQEEYFGLDLPSMDAVKLTKRDLSEELTDSKMKEPYDSQNSFGRTYGEHREVLELSDEEHAELYRYAKAQGLELIETLCSKGAMSLLEHFTPDRLKVASRDLTNLPLLEALAETRIPMILSTGMGGKEELDQALDAIAKYHDEVAILHCVSEYPTHPDNWNLRSILYLLENYPDKTIGFSDHTIGISAPVVAVGMGAEIVEKHITLDHRMKGTDQKASLGPDGIYRMVRDVRLLEKGMGKKDLFIEPSVDLAKVKLERSIASKHRILKGQVIEEGDIHLLSPGDGFKWSQRDQVVGKLAQEEIPPNETIYPHLIGDQEGVSN